MGLSGGVLVFPSPLGLGSGSLVPCVKRLQLDGLGVEGAGATSGPGLRFGGECLATPVAFSGRPVVVAGLAEDSAGFPAVPTHLLVSSLVDESGSAYPTVPSHALILPVESSG